MLKKENQKGFTIIEVLIVLAIAGLIMLIVFLAVPALQRNARNTQARDAAAAILSTANEFVTNNNGQLPTAVTIGTDGTITVSAATGTSATSKTQPGFTAGTTAIQTPETGKFQLAIGRTCNGNVLNTTNTPRAMSVVYFIETSSTPASQCVTG